MLIKIREMASDREYWGTGSRRLDEDEGQAFIREVTAFSTSKD